MSNQEFPSHLFREDVRVSMSKILSPIYAFFMMMHDEDMAAGEVGLVLFDKADRDIHNVFDAINKHYGGNIQLVKNGDSVGSGIVGIEVEATT